MAHKRLEERLVGNPRVTEEAHDIRARPHELQNGLDRLPPEAPPLTADHYIQVRGNFSFHPKHLLNAKRRIEPPRLGAFVEPVAIDQALFPKPGLDPVGCEKVERLDEINVMIIQVFMEETELDYSLHLRWGDDRQACFRANQRP